MEKFAQYAFNKSHSTCYALIAYQCAYLKANYPSEFMAGLMSNNMDKTDDIKKYIEVSKKMGLEVLGPDVNESNYIFTVNAKGQIRFGLSAIKGVGENVIKEMVQIRETKGRFEDVYDFVSRMGSKNANKKVLEALAISGALDCFSEVKREQYFGAENTQSFIEKLIRYANDLNRSKVDETNLFGESFQDMVEKPTPPSVSPFSELEKLEKEKEVLGLYMSGHPLDRYKKLISDITMPAFEEVKLSKKTEIILGMVKDIVKGTSTNQKPYLKFELVGLEDNMSFTLRDKNYDEFGKYIEDGKAVMLKVKWDSFKPKNENRLIEFMKIESVIPESNFFQQANKFTISLLLSETNQETIARLEYVLKKHQGNIPVVLSLESPISKIEITTDEEPLDIAEEELKNPVIAIEFKSLAFKIKPSEEFLTDLYDVISLDKVKLAV